MRIFNIGNEGDHQRSLHCKFGSIYGQRRLSQSTWDIKPTALSFPSICIEKNSTQVPYPISFIKKISRINQRPPWIKIGDSYLRADKTGGKVHLDWSLYGGSENFRIYYTINDFTFSNPSVLQETTNKTYDHDVLNDGKNYAYRIFKNVPTEGLFFYHTDHLMTPLQMTDENQNVIWQAEYYPFGRIYYKSGDIENNIRFPGQYSEPDLNLYYNWHRYYFYKIGRYNKIKTNEIKSIISEDIYPYVWANPIIHMDLNGLYGKRARNCINSIGKGGSDEEPYAITVCDGCDWFEWRWIKKPECGDECFKNHEEAHIAWFEVLRPDACKGRPKASNPALEPGDKPKTECYAYEVSSKCMEEMRIRVNMSGYTQKCRTFIKINYKKQIKHMREFCELAGGWAWW